MPIFKRGEDGAKSLPAFLELDGERTLGTLWVTPKRLLFEAERGIIWTNTEHLWEIPLTAVRAINVRGLVLKEVELQYVRSSKPRTVRIDPRASLGASALAELIRAAAQGRVDWTPEEDEEDDEPPAPVPPGLDGPPPPATATNQDVPRELASPVPAAGDPLPLTASTATAPLGPVPSGHWSGVACEGACRGASGQSPVQRMELHLVGTSPQLRCAVCGLSLIHISEPTRPY